MALMRLIKAAGAVQQGDVVVVGVLAAVATAFQSLVTVTNALLVVAFAIVLLANFVSGVTRSWLDSRPGEEWFVPRKMGGGLAKLVLFASLVGICVALDIISAHAFGEVVADLSPLTKTGICAGIWWQVTSTLNNAEGIPEFAPIARLIRSRISREPGDV